MKRTVLLLAALLGGCATTIDGVKITDEDRQACKVSRDCTVWSVAELRALVVRAFAAGAAKAAQDKSGI